MGKTFRPVELDDAQLAMINHHEYLEGFAATILQSMPAANRPSRTNGPGYASGKSVPERLGMATRLQWAARYIRLLQTVITTQEARIAQLEHAEKSPDGDCPPRPAA
jgi:hypothetical protein